MKRIIDLTHKITSDMPVFPGDPKVELGRDVLADSAYDVSYIKMGSHTGTHIDAPMHLKALSGSLSSISLSKLVGVAFVIDLGYAMPDSTIGLADLEPYADRITQGSQIILKTHWSRYWNTPDYFLSYPDLSKEAAEFFAERKINLLAIEQPSTHKILHEEIHKSLLTNGIALIENLANTDEIKSDRVFLVALPLNLAELDGAPARVVCIEYDENVIKKLEQV